MTQRKRLAIIDGKSIFYRGYFAVPNLSTKDGTPTGGVFGFATMALEVIKRLKPDYVAVAWDKPKTNIRSRLKLYPEYKAGRKPAPPDFYAQIPLLHELLEAFGWPLYELDDYEADDIMGALAVQAKEKDIETFLVTSDLDMLQLVNGHTHVYALKTGLSNIQEFDEAGFKVKYGIDVHQFIDLKALKGDSSDNIPGVPGVGEKGALDLLKQYKTLDGVYENLDLIKETVRKKLEAGKDSAYLSKKLVTLMLDAPIKLNLKEVDGSKADPVKIQETLQKLEFKSLARQLPEIMNVPESHGVANTVTHVPTGKNIIVDSNDKADLKLGDSEYMYIHSRSAGKHGKDPQVICLSLDGKTTYNLDLQKLNHKVIADYFRDVRPLVGYDLKSTYKVLMALGVAELPTVGFDIQVGTFLINPLRREQSLTELASTDLGFEGSAFENSTPEEILGRGAEIISFIKTLHDQQATNLGLKQNSKLKLLAETVDFPIIPVLARMEYTGIKLDVDYIKNMSGEVEDIISDLEQQIYGHADQEFNIGSPAQLAEVLFNKLNLPKDGIKRGKTGYSTAASELDKLRAAHPIIDLISQYREVTKLKNTYIDTLPKQVDENSRLHTTYALTVAQTGRLSSNDPNLQNIPVRTELGRRIRTAFVAAPEHVLVSADYSQFELRLAAYLCKDDDLIKQFNEDVDVHTATAAEVYGRQPEDVTKNMRRAAKAVNFGIMYGQGPHGLVQTTGMSYAEAKHFIDKYFEVRPKLKGYIEGVQEQARKRGYVETLFGRRRPTPDVHSSNFVVREAAMRAAVNMPFQGSAADIMKMAMIAVAKKLAGTENQMLLQIHDSILVECPKSSGERIAKLLKDTMEGVVKLPIKLTVDTDIGENWGEL
ncbi:MAG: DNA polymerase I [Candidatus Saccharimonadales bacterium]